jgi:hypothetical protein
VKKAGKGCACHSHLLLGLRPEVNLEKGPEINGMTPVRMSKNACAHEAFLRRCDKIMVLTA